MPDKYIIPLIVFGTLLLLMFVFIIATFMVIYKQRQRQHELEKNEIAYLYQNNLLRTRLEVEELALKSISREIHDNVNQVLGIVRMNLFHAPKTVSREEANHYIAEANGMVKDAIDHLRDLSHTLSGSGITKMGLISAIQKEAKNFSIHSDVNCIFDCEEDRVSIGGAEEILIFRIIQESLANVVKHSMATEVRIILERNEDMLDIIIKDNGSGRISDKPPDGMGLINMHERAAMLHARLNIDFEPGKGCTVHLRVTLPDRG